MSALNVGSLNVVQPSKKTTQRTHINKAGGVQEDTRGIQIGGMDDECYSVLNKYSREKMHVSLNIVKGIMDPTGVIQGISPPFTTLSPYK